MRSAYRPHLAGIVVRCPECGRKVAATRGKFAQHWPADPPKGPPCKSSLRKVKP